MAANDESCIHGKGEPIYCSDAGVSFHQILNLNDACLGKHWLSFSAHGIGF